MNFLILWEVSKISEYYFACSSLFMALCRLYKNAYFGQGFHLTSTHSKVEGLQEQIDKLPLDVSRIIYSRIWNKGEPFKGVVIKKGKLLLNFDLHYLIVQYGKLKSIVKTTISMIYVGCNGIKVGRKMYIFRYGPINPTSIPLIFDFICRKKNPISFLFGLICP